MFRKTLLILPAAMLGALPLLASAETLSGQEMTLFRAAGVTLTQAADAARQAHPGALASVAFGDEDGRAAYAAVVVGNDGQPWTVLVDAQSGDVFASARSSAMQEHEDGAESGVDNHEDGETQDD